jgi:formylglycine-generating enzyme required for sulfatase activity
MLQRILRPLRVFLCHASIDKPVIHHLYQRLISDGIDAWLDESKLLPGQDWRLEIPKAVSSSDVVIICLSNNSINREGYIQKEIRLALDVADEKPEGTIFLIPARLQNCVVPARLSKYQWVDLFIPGGYNKLLKALQIRAESLGLKPIAMHDRTTAGSPGFVKSLLKIQDMEFVSVPAGSFLMGTKGQRNLTLTGEQPQHGVEIPYDYFISRTPVTNCQYARYLKATSDMKFYVHPKKENHPVININWHEAQAYITWLNNTFGEMSPLGYRFRLPSEAEWEKAARGQNDNEWPWGNEWHSDRCNSLEKRLDDTTPVGSFSPLGDSPYGVSDMAGNVWEWTRSLYRVYPYRPNDGREDDEMMGDRVVRGGSYKNPSSLVRCACRRKDFPSNQLDLLGFRVVISKL